MNLKNFIDISFFNLGAVYLKNSGLDHFFSTSNMGTFICKLYSYSPFNRPSTTNFCSKSLVQLSQVPPNLFELNALIGTFLLAEKINLLLIEHFFIFETIHQNTNITPARIMLMCLFVFSLDEEKGLEMIAKLGGMSAYLVCAFIISRQFQKYIFTPQPE